MTAEPYYPVPPDDLPPSVSSVSMKRAKDTLVGWVIPEGMPAFLCLLCEWETNFDVEAFLEKPWKWAREYAVWLDAGSPNVGDLTSDEFEQLVARLESAS